MTVRIDLIGNFLKGVNKWDANLRDLNIIVIYSPLFSYNDVSEYISGIFEFSGWGSLGF